MKKISYGKSSRNTRKHYEEYPRRFDASLDWIVGLAEDRRGGETLAHELVSQERKTAGELPQVHRRHTAGRQGNLRDKGEGHQADGGQSIRAKEASLRRDRQEIRASDGEAQSIRGREQEIEGRTGIEEEGIPRKALRIGRNRMEDKNK